jgi:hypothetical protein
VAISWVRQQPGPVIPLIAARTEEQFRDNLAATDVHLSQQHLDRLDALSRPTLGFPADVMREASVVGGVYGAQLPDIDEPPRAGRAPHHHRHLVVSLATDWATVSSLATAGGTLVLALATFASVRSSNRSARIAEAALQEQRRPVLAPSRFEDPVQKLLFAEGRWISAPGGRAAAEHADGIVYLAISLRNVASGIAVCQGWIVRPELGSGTLPTHAPVEEFRLQSRDLYVPAGDTGIWQGALRHPDDPVRPQAVEAIETGQAISVELLYSDQVGRQRTITRFGLFPLQDTWLAIAYRHWFLDWGVPHTSSW